MSAGVHPPTHPHPANRGGPSAGGHGGHPQAHGGHPVAQEGHPQAQKGHSVAHRDPETG